MRLNILYVLVILFSFSTHHSEAQTKRKQALTLVKYKENVNTPLTVKETKMLEEVYGDKLNEYVLSKPQRLKDIKHLLRNRIVIKQIDGVTDNNKYQTLSQVGLFNRYNGSLTMDTNYDPITFNPLKYNLDYHRRGSIMYRIDNTNYFIIIKSQH